MVFTFWSHSPGSGASFTAINTARILSNVGIKCILIDFDLINPSLPVYFDCDENTHGIDNLIPFVSGGNMTQEMFINNTYKSGSMMLLSGTRHPEQCYFYRAEDLSLLIETAKKIYQAVLIDTSGFPNNAGTYTSLLFADRVFLITDCDMIKIRRFNKVKAFVESETNRSNMTLVLNKSLNGITLNVRDAAEYFGIPDAFELPDLGNDFIRSLNNGKWMEFMQNNKSARNYNNVIENLVKTRILNTSLSKSQKDGDTIARKGIFSAF